MERLHNFKPGQAVRVRANGPGVSLCGCRVSPGEVFYFAYSERESELTPTKVAVMRQNKDFRRQQGLRFLLSDIESVPEPAKPGPVKPATVFSEGEGVKLYRARRKSGSRWVSLSTNYGQGISFTRNMSKAIKTTEEVWYRIMKQWATDLVLGLDYELVPVDQEPLQAIQVTTPEELAKQIGCTWLPGTEDCKPEPEKPKHTFKEGDPVRVLVASSLDGIPVEPGSLKYFAYHRNLQPPHLEEVVVTREREDSCLWKGLRFFLKDIAPEPEEPGTVTAEELARQSGIDWRTEHRAISAEEAARKAMIATPEPVDTVTKDKALELFLDAISAGFGPGQDNVFDRIEAVHYFSERLKEL